MPEMIPDLRWRAALIPSVVTALVLLSTAAAAVVPIDSQGHVERPVGGFSGNDGTSLAPGAFYEGHAANDGRLWVLDRQTGRVRSCSPPSAVDAPPRCSPWSE